MIKLKFQEGISKENSNVRDFIHDDHDETVGKYLVVKFQDNKHASERFEKLDNEEVEMQLNHANLVNELTLSQINQLSILVNQTITNEAKKRRISEPMDFTKTPVNEN